VDQIVKILVTGAKGFIGKNLIAELKNRKYTDIFEFDKETEATLLDKYCKEADFVFHLAGVNRPKEEREFTEGNFGFTATLLDTLKKYNNTCPIMISSSIQAALDNSYGKSKMDAEELLFSYSKETGAKVLVYRFPNVFGKWCKPNYNSVIATFCYNIANDLPITINDPSTLMKLVYIDDVVEELIKALEGQENKVDKFCEVSTVYTNNLGKIADLIYSFKNSRLQLSVPDMSDDFTKKLYSTYLSYLPEDDFSYELKMNVDNRGSFTEFIRTKDRGQVSVNIIKPGIVKGNHWHHTKNEKFLVVSGKGVVRFRKINSDKVIEYYVSGEKLEVVDIPTGYTHNIENLGDSDMVTVMWANEAFNPEKPDTYFLEV
jgi:UDP-2-acetamido-2,6-beta-L-arabino-hexul-4-ose reductase